MPIAMALGKKSQRKNMKKTLDKLQAVWYNKDTKK